MKRLVTVLAVLFLCVVVSSNFVWAIGVDPNATNSFRPNYNSPGARANAMGGAFIGLADDATAAYSNPAGLVVLTKPELAAEFTYKRSKITNYDYGDGFKRTFDYTYSGPSFISFSYPVPNQNANITVYRHELADNDVSWRVYQHYPAPIGTIPLVDVTSHMRITTYALAGAVKLHNTFSVGLAVDINEMSQNVCSTHINPYTIDTYSSTSDWAPGYTASFLWTPHELFHLGAVYKYGAKWKLSVGHFTTTGTTSTNNFYPDSFKAPDKFGVGVSSRPLPGLTLTVDYLYIRYSQSLEDPKFTDGTTSRSYGANGTLYASDYKVDDNYEIHAGAEYAFSFKIPMAVRAGYAYKPDNRVYLDSNTLTSGMARLLMMASPHGDDEHVYSGGLGFVFNNFQLDFAYSHSDINTNYIGSLVWRF